MKWILMGNHIGDVRPSLMALHSLESISKESGNSKKKSENSF